MIAVQLPVWQVILPLLSAPVCLIFYRFPKSVWIFSTLISWCALAISILLMIQVIKQGSIAYEFGGWAVPWGIGYLIDKLNAFMLIIIAATASIVIPYSYQSIQNEIPSAQHGFFYTAMLLCFGGLLGITITGDAFNLFVLLEISSLSTYCLISMGRDRRALTSSLQYLIMGTIGATFVLIGIGLLYMLTGTLNMADLARRLTEHHHSSVLRAAFGFIVIGLGLKIAMFPLHLWLPNAYTFAPSAVTAFLAATATKVAIYVLLRFIYSIFGYDFSFTIIHIQWLFIGLGAISVVTASLVAAFQVNIKRMLAYSSLAQIGYILIGIGLLNQTGLSAALLHLFNHAIIKCVLFLALGAICYRIGQASIENIQGISKQMPWTMAALLIGGLSLIGIPGTAGFISKWYLVKASIERDWWVLTFIILFSSLVTAFYIWRVIEAAYFKQAPENIKAVTEAPKSLLIPTWLLVFANLYFGINAYFVTEYAKSTAGLFIGY